MLMNGSSLQYLKIEELSVNRTSARHSGRIQVIAVASRLLKVPASIAIRKGKIDKWQLNACEEVCKASPQSVLGSWSPTITLHRHQTICETVSCPRPRDLWNVLSTYPST